MLSPKQWEMLQPQRSKEWAASPEIGAVIVTGAGRGFCAGGDVSAMDRGTEMGAKGATLEQKVDSLRERQGWPWLLYTIPKVTIAVVNGPAAGAGIRVGNVL